LRGSTAWGWDSNVREAMEKRLRLGDRFLRLYAEGETGAWKRGRLRGTARIRGLTERYDQYSSESRFQAEAGGDLSARVSRASSVWTTARIEGRTYPDSTERNYGRGHVTLGSTMPLRRGRLSIGATAGGIDYRRTGSFDLRHEMLSAEFRSGAGSRVDLRLQARLEWGRYGRSAIKRAGTDQFGLSGRQRDRIREIEIGASYLAAWLFEAGASWESVRSNSFGYSLGRKSLIGSVSGWLPGEVMLQVRGRIETVSYHDSGLDRVFIIRTGEDQEAGEDNNHLLVRVRRAIHPRVAIDARFSLFRNESLLVGSFYRKSVTSLGFEWRPWGPTEF
jgi:hypothetical protein